MVLDLAVRSMTHGGTAAITRFDVYMPVVPNKICMIRRVHVALIDFARLDSYDVTYGLSLDPEHAPQSLVAADSRMFLMGRYAVFEQTAVGFAVGVVNPIQFHYPEGIPCPYSRLPFFLQNSNNNANTVSLRISVFFELIKMTPQEIAIAVMRRGRGETRRVP